MLIDWDLSVPWWASFLLGFVVATAIGAVIQGSEVRSSRRSVAETKARLRETEGLLQQATALADSVIQESYSDKQRIINELTEARLSQLDRFRNNWSEVQRLIDAFQKCLDSHVAVNVMEASLIRSLQTQTDALRQLIAAQFVDAVDPDGRVRVKLKSVKTETDGGNSGEKEVEVGIQTTSQES